MAWQKLDTTTLGSAGDTITLNGSGSGFTAKKFLKILSHTLASGNINWKLKFNNDSGNNYSNRLNDNGTESTAVSRTELASFSSSSVAYDRFHVCDVIDISAQEKLVITHMVESNTAGAGNAPLREEHIGKWTNTSAQITRGDAFNDGTGDFATSSNVSILGTD